MPNGIYPIPPFHQNAAEPPPARPTLGHGLKSWCREITSTSSSRWAPTKTPAAGIA